MTMPRRTFRRGARRGGTRSPTGWTGGDWAETTLAINTKIILLSFTSAGLPSHETVTRIVGGVAMSPSTAVAAGVFVIGGAVFADAAVAAGVASLPDPITDVADDIWSFIHVMPYIITGGATELVSRFDSRGQRKVEEGQQFVVIGANSTLGSTIETAGYLRLLAKSAIRS